MITNENSSRACDPAYSGANARNSVDAFRDEALRRSQALYPRDKTGCLIIALDPESVAESAVALISEHRPAESRQYQVDLKRGEPAILELPMGGYTVVVRTPGFEPHRGYVEVTAQQAAAVETCLHERARKPATFEERLAKHGLKLGDAERHDLTVAEGTSVTLDGANSVRTANMQVRRIASIDEAKAILGLPDELRPGEQPRYGKMVGPPTGQRAARDEMNIMLDTRFAMREYIYGNSKSVREWKDELDDVVRQTALDFPFHVYTIVTVEAGAVLNVGAAGLFCDLLRVHYTGKIRVIGQGPTTFDTGIYERFYGLDTITKDAQVRIRI